MEKNIVEFKNITKEFPMNKGFFNKSNDMVKAVDNVSFCLGTNKVLGIIGESGSGKSTMMRILMGLENATSGEIYFEDKLLKKDRNKDFKRDVQMIFQDSYSSFNPMMKIKDILSEPFIVHTHYSSKEIKSQSAALLEKVNLQSSTLDKFPHELSGGQRQRINIARALATKPKLIICDEPTSSLDVSTQAQVLNLFKDLQIEEGLTYMFVSHNMSVINFIADTVIVMNKGSIMESGEVDQVFSNPKSDYTKTLINSVPIPDPGVLQFR